MASSLAADLGVAGAPFSMFQFTPLGVVVLVVGTLYLLTVVTTLGIAVIWGV